MAKKIIQIKAEDLKKRLNIKDGENYVLTEKDKSEIAGKIKVPVVDKIIERTEVIKEQPIITNEIKEVAKYEEPEEIVSKLNQLKEALDYSVLKNIPEQTGRVPNGGGWRNLFQLHDVSVPSPTNGQALIYNSATKLWENQTIPTPDISAYLTKDQTTPQTTVGTLHFPNFSADVSLGSEELAPLTGVSGVNWNFGGGGEWASPLNGTIQHIGNGTGNTTLHSPIYLTTGKMYRITFVVSSLTAGSIKLSFGGAFFSPPIITTAGTYVYDIIDDGSPKEVTVRSNDNASRFTCTVSLKEVLNGIIQTSKIQNTDGWNVLQIARGGASRLNLSDPLLGYNSIYYNQIFGGATYANNFDIDGIKTINSYSGNYQIVDDGSAYFAGTDFYADGSGDLSNGLISWDTSGNLTTAGLFNPLVKTINASTVAQTIQGYSGQTADLLQLKNSAGTVLGGRAFDGSMAVGIAPTSMERTNSEQAIHLKSTGLYPTFTFEGTGATSGKWQFLLTSGGDYIFRDKKGGHDPFVIFKGAPNHVISINANGSCGIGWVSGDTQVNTLTVNGRTSIGTSYVTTNAPTNGLIVEGIVGLGLSAPTAQLHLKAGTATASTAPLKFSAGTLLTTPEIGTMEFTDDGTTAHIYGTVRIAGVVTRVLII